MAWCGNVGCADYLLYFRGTLNIPFKIYFYFDSSVLKLFSNMTERSAHEKKMTERSAHDGEERTRKENVSHPFELFLVKIAGAFLDFFATH